jgi:hypothetical protein
VVSRLSRGNFGRRPILFGTTASVSPHAAVPAAAKRVGEQCAEVISDQIHTRLAGSNRSRMRIWNDHQHKSLQQNGLRQEGNSDSSVAAGDATDCGITTCADKCAISVTGYGGNYRTKF